MYPVTLRSHLVDRRSNLPSELSSLVGRTEAINELRRELITARLITLTGPGGIGKTRLAVALGRTVLSDYADGVWLVELASLADRTLVVPTVAAVLGIHEPGQPMLEHLAEVLRTRAVLVVLDNCEHLGRSCAELAEQLLRACPELQIVATSRERLGVSGEVVWRVPGLTSRMAPARVKKAAQLPEAVQLFLERARAISGFLLTEDNSAAVAEVCRQLEGIPLAIELAAGRTRVMTPQEIADRLREPLQVLIGGSRTDPGRHRTLRATLDWSFGLLSRQERSVFSRLSVFAGGCTLESAEHVCADPDEIGDIHAEHIVDLIERLVDQSLVVAQPVDSDGTRYRLLEPVQQYARERLQESGEEAEVRIRHRDWCVALAEAASDALNGPDQRAWLRRLEREHDNLRSALAWSLGTPDSAQALRIAGSLHRFWRSHGHLAEGRAWLARALEANARRAAGVSAAPKGVRLQALMTFGILARQQGDYRSAETAFATCVALARELQDPVGIAESLQWVGSNLFRIGDEKGAEAFTQQSLALWRQLGDHAGMCRPLGTLANVALARGNYDQAITLHAERLQYAREAGDTQQIAGVTAYLGRLTGERGDYDRAGHLLETSYSTFMELGDTEGTARALASLAWLAHVQGEPEVAKQRYVQSLTLFQKLGATWGTSECLLALARLAAETAQFDVAARLFGSAAKLRETHSIRLADDQVFERAAAIHGTPVGRDLETVRTALGVTPFEAAWEAGRSLTVDDAVAVALSIFASAAQPAVKAPTENQPLTPRELEVAMLITRGRSNREIADELIIAVSTAERHVANILSKLDLTSRTQVATWVLKRCPPNAASEVN